MILSRRHFDSIAQHEITFLLPFCNKISLQYQGYFSSICKSRLEIEDEESDVASLAEGILDGIERLEMLFDLETDPGERRSLYYEHPEIARELSRSLKAWEQDVDRS